MDSTYSKRKAKIRKFHDRKSFIRQERYLPKTRYKPLPHTKHFNHFYEEEFIAIPKVRSNKNRGYRYPKRGWELAYRYDRAAFFDQYGYHYGYFNRHGYYFEGVFYAYDRGYRYHDRVKGRGLFDHWYYIPANAEYYGFSRHPYRGF